MEVSPKISRKTLILTGNFATQERVLGANVAKDVKHLFSKLYFKIPYNEISNFTVEVKSLGYQVSKVFLADEIMPIVEGICEKKGIDVPELLTVESILEWIFLHKGTVLSIEKVENGYKVNKPQFLKLKVKLVWDLLELYLQYDKVDMIPKQFSGYWKYIVSNCTYDWKVYYPYLFSCMYLDVLSQIEVRTDWENKTYPISSALTLPDITKEVGQDRLSHKLRSVTSKGMGSKAKKVGGGKEQPTNSVRITTGRSEFPLWFVQSNLPTQLPKGLKAVLGKFFFHREGMQYDVGYLGVKRSKKTKLDYLYFYVNDALRYTNTKELEREVLRLEYLISQTEDKDEQRELRQQIYLKTFDIPIEVVITLLGLNFELKGNIIPQRSPFDWGTVTHCLMVHPKFPKQPSHYSVETYNQYVDLYNEVISLPKVKFSNGKERDAWEDKPIIVIQH
jgi:hypothetical protein